MFDATQPAGRNYYWKSEDLPSLTDPAIDTIVAHSENITSPHSVVALFQLGGAAGRVPEDACAYSHRNARHAININASWTDEDSDKHIAWARDFDTAMQPYTLGVWLGDGTAAHATITSYDPFIREEIERRGYRTSDRATHHTFGILGVQPALRALNVLQNKHIPPLYLRASIEQRRALLQGLIDTDGHVARDGQVEFTSI
ncbi:hypothetical protein LCGC14_2463160, partial [marine sediment metagenome]